MNDKKGIEALSTCYELAASLVSLSESREILKDRAIRLKKLPLEKGDEINVPNDLKAYQAEQQFLEAYQRLTQAGRNTNQAISAVRSLQDAIEHSGCSSDPRFVVLMEMLRENRNVK